MPATSSKNHPFYRQQQGTPDLNEAAQKWRAGKAGDTITVVIYSMLPVVSLA
jgi:hypothetical protein